MQQATVVAEGEAIALLDAALRSELGIAPMPALPPEPADEWQALLGLALVSLHTDRARDTLALHWRCGGEDIDRRFAGMAGLGLATGLGSSAFAPTPDAYLEITRFMIDSGRLAAPG